MPYADKEKQKKFQRDHFANKNLIRRITVIEFLGGSCVRCDESDFTCLQFDHIKPILRAGENVRAGKVLIQDIYMDREDLEGLQVLCANCHMKKTYQEDKFLFPLYIT